MAKVSELMSSILEEMNKTEKSAADQHLSKENSLPTISTDLAKALIKVSDALRNADENVSYEDLNAFVEKLNGN